MNIHQFVNSVYMSKIQLIIISLIISATIIVILFTICGLIISFVRWENILLLSINYLFYSETIRLFIVCILILTITLIAIQWDKW